jgi:hypothetical protein
MKLEEFYTSIRKDREPVDIITKSADDVNFDKPISSHTAHYLHAFQRNKHPELLFVNWNWIACLFPPIWTLYRRLYSVYILLMISAIILSYIPNGILISPLINIGFGIFGDSVYIYFVRQAYLRKQSMNPGNIPLIVLVGIHLLISIGIYYLSDTTVNLEVSNNSEMKMNI